jgi:hypothetical protein
VQQPVVDRTCPSLQFGQVGEHPVAAQVTRRVDDGFDAQRDAVFEVLFDPGVLTGFRGGCTGCAAPASGM